ncbi:MAG: hypothetical protein ACK48U_02655, partial [Planctomyces sp.]
GVQPTPCFQFTESPHQPSVEAIAVDMSAAYVKAAKYVWLTSLENLTEKQQALFDNRGRSPRC